MILSIFRNFIRVTYQTDENSFIFCDVRNVTVFAKFRHIFGPPKFRSSRFRASYLCLVRYAIKIKTKINDSPIFGF